MAEKQINDIVISLYQREDLDVLEKEIMLHLTKVSRLKLQELMKLTGKARNTVSKRIKILMNKGLIDTVGDINSPTRYYFSKTNLSK